ncbi:hypothetical protein CERSUDRAFT_110266 [Gelatoporia subvermispora B]|uniref:Uncharacterized protein n=1 Tax=Ceriporiopsis subvermispora (strain B) TaxID=914234 RepID=M2PXQ3_CERS8|nr:hypothetical protein CERSUDRAFT_110266 [Gelatoporia subvermispora B]
MRLPDLAYGLTALISSSGAPRVFEFSLYQVPSSPSDCYCRAVSHARARKSPRPVSGSVSQSSLTGGPDKDLDVTGLDVPFSARCGYAPSGLDIR